MRQVAVSSAIAEPVGNARRVASNRPPPEWPRLGRFPNDEYLAALIEDLLTVSPRFAELWHPHPVAQTAN